MLSSNKNGRGLKSKVEKAKQQVKVGGRYAHFKNPVHTYIVRDIAILESTQEPVVIYRAEYGDNITFVRPVDEWLEVVEKDGQQVPRFRKI